MNELLKSTIQKYYEKKDVENYLLKCGEILQLPSELNVYLNKNEIDITDLNSEDIWPSTKFIFEFRAFKKGGFTMRYSSTLLISKLLPIFYLQHEFEIESPDENLLMPVLNGYDGQPYTIQQQKLEQVINKTLLLEGYMSLSYAEINEVIEEIQFQKDVSFFGPQVTVEYALFHDVLDACPD
ncbi:hypothetical protein QUF88_01705 [Bacillus sp. DX1.1]|uniref:hypothetical protein n=1 Tax=unclassified Bacillus (in: firmicutes) TaxID=185979 RepID=UPI00256FBDB7|nr:MULTISPECIES: hypothetical protein [unclassified Bacillus (in: firmicutes)]MDM5152699.1 hypothetical protein [Bacillus sp. DX1.1]WJE84402.1 hypothetical protein QRE67_26495 [Bacillus sp. DX3.1]